MHASIYMCFHCIYNLSGPKHFSAAAKTMSSWLPISAPATFKVPGSVFSDQCPKFTNIRAAGKGILEAEPMPKHLAVIMDGNRRWAVERGLPPNEGHRAGFATLKRMSRLCLGMGVHTVSIFAFSTENWNRPKAEVDYLMNLFEEVSELASDADTQYETYGGRVSIMGDTSKLPQSAVRLITGSEPSMKGNKGPQLLVALNYGGRQDIVGATRAIASKVKNGQLSVREINDKLFEGELQTNCTDYPSPDFLIRTSGEKRISNFMLWQTADTELHFVDKCFPDLEEQDFIDAMVEFQLRKRLLGGKQLM